MTKDLVISITIKVWRITELQQLETIPTQVTCYYRVSSDYDFYRTQERAPNTELMRGILLRCSVQN